MSLITASQIYALCTEQMDSTQAHWVSPTGRSPDLACKCSTVTSRGGMRVPTARNQISIFQISGQPLRGSPRHCCISSVHSGHSTGRFMRYNAPTHSTLCFAGSIAQQPAPSAVRQQQLSASCMHFSAFVLMSSGQGTPSPVQLHWRSALAWFRSARAISCLHGGHSSRGRVRSSPSSTVLSRF